jgi:phosphate transport system permease protein
LQLTQTNPDHIKAARRHTQQRRNQFFDGIFRHGTQLIAISILILLALILIMLFRQGLPAFHKFGMAFLWTHGWDPVLDNYGAAAPVVGTLITASIAMLFAVPVSFGIAVFITELSPTWLQQPLSAAIELLAGIPSVIYGMWGLFVLAPAFAKLEPKIQAFLGDSLIAPLFSGPPMGIGVFTAGFVLAIMTIPFISSVMRDVFLATPRMLKESAYGVGATTWEVVRSVVLPYTKTGVLGGIFLGLGRALGETMAVTFVIGNAHELSTSLFAPGTSISAVLANEFSEATTPMYKSSLMALGFVLFVITFIVLILARLLLRGIQSKELRGKPA